MLDCKLKTKFDMNNFSIKKHIITINRLINDELLGAKWDTLLMRWKTTSSKEQASFVGGNKR